MCEHDFYLAFRLDGEQAYRAMRDLVGCRIPFAPQMVITSLTGDCSVTDDCQSLWLIRLRCRYIETDICPVDLYPVSTWPGFAVGWKSLKLMLAPERVGSGPSAGPGG
jgi:hypothetical protein